MMREVEDEETLFDQETLLNTGTVKFSGNSSWCRRFTKTVVLSIAFFALGLCIAIPGPTLMDLSERVKTNTEHISLIFTARSVGYLIGSIVGGFLFDHFDQQILLFYSLFLTAIATTVAPWCTSLTVLAVMISFQGVSMGVLDTGGNVFCIKIWGKKSSPYMQVVHFAFGIGAFVAPLLARPFLMNPQQNVASNHSLSRGVLPVMAGDPHYSPLILDEKDNYLNRYLRDNHESEQNISSSLINRTADSDSSFTNNLTTSNLTSANVSQNLVTMNVQQTTTAVPKKPVHSDSSLFNPDFADGNVMKKLKDHESSGGKLVGQSEEINVKSPNVKSDVSLNPGNGTESTQPPVSSSPPPNITETALGNISDTDVKNNLTANNTEVSALPSSTTNLPTSSPLPSSTPPSTTASTTTLIKSTTPKISEETKTPSPPLETTTTLEPVAPTQAPSKPEDTTGDTSISVAPSVTQTPDHGAEDKTNPNSTDTTVTPERPTKPQTVSDIVNSAFDKIKHMSKIQFAYLIIGVLLLINAFMFLVLYCKDRNKASIFIRDEEHDGVYGKESRSYRIIMLVILFIFFFVYVGMEVTYGGLLSTFSYEEMNWPKPKGAVLTAIFWGSLAAGRGFAIFIARCFKPPCMLVTDLVLVLIGAIILCFGIQKVESLLWVGTLVIGFGMSSIFPTGVSWADQYFPLTGKSTAVFVVGSALGEMVIPAFTGYMFEKFSKMTLMYIMLVLSVILGVIYTVMQCFASRKPKSFKSARNGFVPLREDENVQMDTLNMNGEGAGLLETSRFRKHPKPANMELEYSRLVDIDD